MENHENFENLESLVVVICEDFAGGGGGGGCLVFKVGYGVLFYGVLFNLRCTRLHFVCATVQRDILGHVSGTKICCKTLYETQSNRNKSHSDFKMQLKSNTVFQASPPWYPGDVTTFPQCNDFPHQRVVVVAVLVLAAGRTQTTSANTNHGGTGRTQTTCKTTTLLDALLIQNCLLRWNV